MSYSLSLGSLGYDVLTARCDSLRYERRYLATILYLLGRMGYIAPDDIKAMVSWIQANTAHAMVYYLLPTVLSCFDIVDFDTVGGRARYAVATDASLITALKAMLAPTTIWQDNGLKSVILLKWTLFMAETRHQHPDLEIGRAHV